MTQKTITISPFVESARKEIIRVGKMISHAYPVNVSILSVDGIDRMDIIIRGEQCHNAAMMLILMGREGGIWE